MAQIGQIPVFDIRHPERWESHVGQVEFFLRLNHITEHGMKVAALLCISSPAIYDLAVGLCSSTAIRSVTYSDLLEKLDNHFSPRMLELAWRFQFEKRDQLPGESAADFIAAVRQAARLCKFSNLDEWLRDWIIFGLRDQRL